MVKQSKRIIQINQWRIPAECVDFWKKVSFIFQIFLSLENENVFFSEQNLVQHDKRLELSHQRMMINGDKNFLRSGWQIIKDFWYAIFIFLYWQHNISTSIVFFFFKITSRMWKLKKNEIVKIGLSPFLRIHFFWVLNCVRRIF